MAVTQWQKLECICNEFYVTDENPQEHVHSNG